MEDTRKEIALTRAGSAPRPDLIGNYILKLLPDPVLVFVIKCFNQIMEDGSFPSMWKQFDTVFIPKVGVKQGFRPISLSSCTLKIFERLVKNRLDRYIELDYILPISQYRFRKGRSCEHCLSIINVEIHKSFLLNKSTGGLFLDIEGAYDNVSV